MTCRTRSLIPALVISSRQAARNWNWQCTCDLNAVATAPCAKSQWKKTKSTTTRTRTKTIAETSRRPSQDRWMWACLDTSAMRTNRMSAVAQSRGAMRNKHQNNVLIYSAFQVAVIGLGLRLGIDSHIITIIQLAPTGETRILREKMHKKVKKKRALLSTEFYSVSQYISGYQPKAAPSQVHLPFYSTGHSPGEC